MDDLRRSEMRVSTCPVCLAASVAVWWPRPVESRTATPSPVAEVCASDCDGDPNLTVDDLVRAVRRRLELADANDCAGIDTGHSGSIEIGEVLHAVSQALGGCGVDELEPDDNAALARPIGCGESSLHSLVPGGDRDWLAFRLDEMSSVVIETLGERGDTIVQIRAIHRLWRGATADAVVRR